VLIAVNVFVALRSADFTVKFQPKTDARLAHSRCWS